jgi:hypothetical protein
VAPNVGDANNSRRTIPSLAEDVAAIAGHAGRRPVGMAIPRSRTTTFAQPRMFGKRDYLLPHTVHSNIPHQHGDGEPVLWAYAGGLLLETCYALPLTPLALFVGAETDTDGDTTAVVLTIVATDENTDRKTGSEGIVTVVWRQDRGTGAQGRDVWQLTGGARRHQLAPGFSNEPLF